MKRRLSAVIIVNQGGNCITPIEIFCEECALFCENGGVCEGKYRNKNKVLNEAKTYLKEGIEFTEEDAIKRFKK